jgi:hypothetical protein
LNSRGENNLEWIFSNGRCWATGAVQAETIQLKNDLTTDEHSAAKPQPQRMEDGGWRMEKKRFALAQESLPRLRELSLL